jgi:hypothetical protein
MTETSANWQVTAEQLPRSQLSPAVAADCPWTSNRRAAQHTTASRRSAAMLSACNGRRMVLWQQSSDSGKSSCCKVVQQQCTSYAVSLAALHDSRRNEECRMDASDDWGCLNASHVPAVGAADWAVTATGVRAAAPPNFMAAGLLCSAPAWQRATKRVVCPRTSQGRPKVE